MVKWLKNLIADWKRKRESKRKSKNLKRRILLFTNE